MQIFYNLWRVIFMLSTIVYVTDCCSSRILLLKEHTMKIVRHAQPQQHHQNHHHHHHIYEHDSSSLQLQQKLPQHVDIVTNTVREYNKNFSSEMHSQQESKEKKEEAEEDDDHRDSSTTMRNNEMDYTTVPYLSDYFENNTESYADSDVVTTETTTMPMRNTTESTTNSEINSTTVNNVAIGNVNHSDDFITDPAIREQHAGNAKYHIIDLYYTIMRDVLSFECYGLFLTEFCLNRGRCFRYPIGNDSLPSCKCADGYVGERCEFKSVDGPFVSPSLLIKDVQKPKILMARFVISFPMLIVYSVIYLLIAALVVFRKPKSRANVMLVS